jgi:hypothetical protein
MTTATKTTDATGTMDRLERETCSRCGGTGQHSYCPQYGTTCFKCAGRKEVLTKRGRVAMEFLTALKSRRADSLKPGDVVRYEMLAGTHLASCCWCTVAAVAVHEDGRLQIDLTARGVEPLTLNAWQPETLFRVPQTAEQNLDALRQAIEFQATLTKQGKPRVK